MAKYKQETHNSESLGYSQIGGTVAMVHNLDDSLGAYWDSTEVKNIIGDSLIANNWGWLDGVTQLHLVTE